MSEEFKYSLFRESYEPFKKYWHFLLANVALGILINLAFWSDPQFELQIMLIATFWSFSVCYTQWSGNALIAGWLNRKISWMERPILRTVLGILATAVYSTVAYFVVQLAMKFIFFQEVPKDLLAWILAHMQTPIFISMGFSLFFVTVGFFKRWRESAEKADKFQAQMMTYKYEALRNQINPHFLFNSFNVLSDLVYEDQDLASKFIQQLSELYRYVLDSRDKELVPLEEELAFIDAYLFLLRTRFEDKLQVEMKVEAKAGEVIVPMCLQLLIENAVKHNEVSNRHPLRVVVEEEGEWLVVRNSLFLKNVGSDSKQTGLKNLKDQYALWTQRSIEVMATDTEFVVRVPKLRRTGE